MSFDLEPKFLPQKGPIAATNAAPVDKLSTQAFAKPHGRLSLMHRVVGGVEVMIWYFSEELNAWIRCFATGSTEIIPADTLVNYAVPFGVRLYFQVSIATSLYVGGINTKDNRPWGTPLIAN